MEVGLCVPDQCSENDVLEVVKKSKLYLKIFSLSSKTRKIMFQRLAVIDHTRTATSKIGKM